MSHVTAYLAAAICLCFSAVAIGHPFHTSTAEMEFNEQSGSFEISLKLLSSDLDKVLELLDAQRSTIRNHSGEIIDSPPAKTREAKAIEYISNRFYLSRETKSSRVRFVGLEQDKATVWIYFELVPPAGDEALILTNKVFNDLNAGQINTVLLSNRTGKSSLKMDEKQPSVTLPHSIFELRSSQ